MAAAVEIANAYLALYTKMPGVKKDITQALGGSDVQGALVESGKKSGNSFMGALGGILKGGALAVGAVAAAGIGVALVKGFGRLQAIDTAEKKLTGLGHSAETVEAILGNARAAVTGTAFGLGDAATTAASLVAANIAPGEQLESVLKSVANSAAAAGTGLGDMGSIYAKVASLGKAQNDVLQQVSERGIPIYQKLGEQLGVTADEVFEMASAGEIGFSQFESAMTAASGTVAAEMGKTIPGAIDNMLASLGRIGAGILGGIYPYISPLIQAITSALGPLEGMAKQVGEQIATVVGPALQWLTDMLAGGIDVSGFFEILGALSPMAMLFQVLAPILPMLIDMFVRLGTVLGGAVATVFQTLLPLVQDLAMMFANQLAAIMPTVIIVLNQLAGVVAQVITAIAPLIAQVVSGLMPVFSLLAPVIMGLLPVFMSVISVLIPLVNQIFPILASLINSLVPIFLMLVAAVLPLLEPILALLEPLLELVGVILPPLVQLISFLAGVIVDNLSLALSFLIPIITGVVNSISTFLIPVIDTLIAYFGGLITFLTGVFTGDWDMAWQGVLQIFSAIWQGIQDIGKGALNSMIDLINGVINGINGLAGGLSDLTGGAIDLQIGEIPHLANGGVISARPGGIMANIGEGRYDEAVIPLSPSILSTFGGSGSGGGLNQTNNFAHMPPEIAVDMAGQRLTSAARRARV